MKSKLSVLAIALLVAGCEVPGSPNRELRYATTPTDAQAALSSGADVNATDPIGQTPLMTAAHFGHADVAEFLIARGANVDAADSVGDTALFNAAKFNHPDIIALLLAHGADPTTAIQGVDGDKFSPSITVRGFQLTADDGGLSRSYFVRSFIDKTTHTVTDQLYVDVQYSGTDWNFFQSASDENAKILGVTKINASVVNCDAPTAFSGATCNYDETVGVDLDDQVLRQKASTGYQIKVTAHSGAWFIVTLDPRQIWLQTASIEKLLKTGS